MTTVTKARCKWQDGEGRAKTGDKDGVVVLSSLMLIFGFPTPNYLSGPIATGPNPGLKHGSLNPTLTTPLHPSTTLDQNKLDVKHDWGREAQEGELRCEGGTYTTIYTLCAPRSALSSL